MNYTRIILLIMIFIAFESICANTMIKNINLVQVNKVIV